MKIPYPYNNPVALLVRKCESCGFLHGTRLLRPKNKLIVIDYERIRCHRCNAQSKMSEITYCTTEHFLPGVLEFYRKSLLGCENLTHLSNLLEIAPAGAFLVASMSLSEAERNHIVTLLKELNRRKGVVAS